jgi:hypothetical protein
MSLAVVGALVIGKWPEAAMVVFLFAIAEAIEALSLERARNAIKSLTALAPETAEVMIDGGGKTSRWRVCYSVVVFGFAQVRECLGCQRRVWSRSAGSGSNYRRKPTC